MRKPPGLRAGWDATQPVDLGQLTRPAEPWPPAGPTKPASSFQRARLTPDFQPTRPATDFQPTRPATDWLTTRPAVDFQPTRPADPWQVTRPAPLQSPARAAVPRQAVAPTAAAATRPAAPAVLPKRPLAPPPAPRGGSHWQVAGEPGRGLVLMPGQMHIGQQVTSLRTLLGSCVAITLWHPQRRIGGMCHFLLPQRQRRPGEPPDGRYGDEAVEAMVLSIKALRTSPEEYVAHLYGGADTMSGTSAAKFNIGERNIEQGWTLIDRYGFLLEGVDVGEDIPRMVSLSLADGQVNMRRGTGQAPDHLSG